MVEPITSQRNTATPTARSLWCGLLGAPSVWMAHFLAIWVITEWGCLAGWAHSRLLGFQAITALLVIVTGIALPLVVAAGLLSGHNWRRARASANDQGTDDRSAYMSLGGVALSTLFGFAIVLESLPALLLGSCG
jgi:hypothetical protein